MNKKIISTLLIGLSTTFVAPALEASATEVKAVATTAQNGWVQEGANWYYYVNGQKQTGWIHPSKWYYMNKDGVMQTGWIQDNGKWYYLESSGAMKTGWVQVSGKWYYLNNDGVMQTGWIQLSGKWYYLNTDGSMKTGWFKDTNGKQYYLNSSGEMLANTYTPDGYYVDGNGVWDGKAANAGQAKITSLLNTAYSQLGYTEKNDNITIYGDWYGLNGQSWCAMFVSWCANQAGIPTTTIPRHSLCSDGATWFKNKGLWKNGSSTPKAGDIIYFNSNGAINHVGIVKSVSGTKVTTIEGNSSDKVAERTYTIGDTNRIAGYGCPKY